MRSVKSIFLFRLHGNKIGGTESACNHLSALLSDDYTVKQFYLLDGGEGTDESAFMLVRRFNNKFLLFVEYFFLLRKFAIKSEICISTDMSTSVLLLIHKLLGLKSKVYCWEHYPFDKNSKFWSFLFKKTYLHKLATSVICISSLAELDFKFCTKLIVIPNSVKQPLTKVQYEPSGILRCLFIGRIVKDKGVGRLAELFARIDPKRYSLTVVGGGTELDLLSKKFESNKNIHFEGPSNTVDKYYNDFDVFVSGSFYECFPITVLEAMSYGLPVISMDTSGGTQAVLANSGGGFICEDAIEFISKLEYLFNFNNRKFCGNKGREYLYGNYSSEVIKKYWLDLLNDN